jgi:hypothetical protein
VYPSDNDPYGLGYPELGSDAELESAGDLDAGDNLFYGRIDDDAPFHFNTAAGTIRPSAAG